MFGASYATSLFARVIPGKQLTSILRTLGLRKNAATEAVIAGIAKLLDFECEIARSSAGTARARTNLLATYCIHGDFSLGNVRDGLHRLRSDVASQFDARAQPGTSAGF